MSTTTTTTDPNRRLLRVGMIGGGTVGGGVYELLTKYWSNRIVVSHLCVRSLEKQRTFAMDPNTTTITTDPSVLYNDPNIDCIVEVMGGTTTAKDIVMQSLLQKKSVVTANKALIAEYLDDLQETLVSVNAANDQKVYFGYEAAVCGGIPIIHILQSVYVADTIHSLMGICNGTTNYMLSEMFETGANYEDVLRTAQQLGYAEADPSADVDGYDVRSKIAILTKLAYGITVPNPAQTISSCVGISKITAADIAFAKHYNCTIKLLGYSIVKNNDTTKSSLSIYVTPTLVPCDTILGRISGSGNGLAITSQNMEGTAMYTGPGAGRYPTANSIVTDLVRIYNHTATDPPFPRSTSHLVVEGTNHESSSMDSNIVFDSNYTAPSFYIRINVQFRFSMGTSASCMPMEELQQLLLGHWAAPYPSLNLCIYENGTKHIIQNTNDENTISMQIILYTAATSPPMEVKTLQEYVQHIQSQIHTLPAGYSSTGNTVDIFYMPFLQAVPP